MIISLLSVPSKQPNKILRPSPRFFHTLINESDQLKHLHYEAKKAWIGAGRLVAKLVMVDLPHCID